jgi:predicted ATP-binding protein involved in virulence
MLVEGRTEELFIKQIMAPYLAEKNIFVIPTILSKPGEKGGDVKFSRAQKDIESYLKQRNDTYITTLIDYYGIKEWPGYEESKKVTDFRQKSKIFCDCTLEKVSCLFEKHNVKQRFIPYVSMHEFEALFFSDVEILASCLNVQREKIEENIRKLLPEEINDNRETAPSKRLKSFSANYTKINLGLNIAKNIGIQKMREKCVLFDKWVSRLENLPH